MSLRVDKINNSKFRHAVTGVIGCNYCKIPSSGKDMMH